MCRICLYLLLVTILVFVYGQQQLGSNCSQVPVGDSDMVLIPDIVVIINQIRIASCNPLKLKDTVLLEPLGGAFSFSLQPISLVKGLYRPFSFVSRVVVVVGRLIDPFDQIDKEVGRECFRKFLSF